MSAYNLVANKQLVTLSSGKSYKMFFNFRALAETINAYAVNYGRRIDVPGIIAELGTGDPVSIAALSYGALVAGGLKVNWELFWSELFTFDSYDAFDNAVAAGVQAMFPKPESVDEDEPPEGDEKN